MVIAVGSAEVLFLHLHFSESRGEPTDDGLVGDVVGFDFGHDAEVEDEFVAEVFFVVDADGEAEDAVFTTSGTDGDVSVAKRLTRNDKLCDRTEVEQRRRGHTGFWNYGAWWFLVDDFDSW